MQHGLWRLTCVETGPPTGIEAIPASPVPRTVFSATAFDLPTKCETESHL
jgi:hypothetical protein